MTALLISPLYLLEQTSNVPSKSANRESLYDSPKNLKMSTETKKVNITENLLEKKNTASIEDTKNNINEELNDNPKQSLANRIKQEWQLILKIVELIINSLSIAFFYEPASKSENLGKRYLDQVGLIFVAYAGYILINAILIVSRCLKDKIPFKTLSIFSSIGCLLNFVAAILLIVNRQTKFQAYYSELNGHTIGMITTATALSFVNSVIYGIDGIFTFIKKEDF